MLKLNLRCILNNSPFGFVVVPFRLKSPKYRCSNYSKILKLVVSLSLLATSLCFSQECDLVLEGIVVDLHDNSPVSAAVIEVVDSKKTVFSDANGVFILENQCSGKINLKISQRI